MIDDDSTALGENGTRGRSAEQMIEELQLLARERPSELLELASEFADREVRAPASALLDAVLGGGECSATHALELSHQ